jgi:nickel/cobalt transporter (NicO) family protein
LTSFTTLLQQGNSWLFVPSAILLGALHGLEPGHSKTMMAAFIVAIRGTVAQAVLLGLAATVSHTAIVWAIALGGLYFGRQWNSATTEPYFQVASAVLIIGVALWMMWRTWRHRADFAGPAHDHDHHHQHGHHHGEHEAARRIDTVHGMLRLQIYEQGVPPRFRLATESGAGWPAEQVQLETERADGSRQTFSFHSCDGYLESEQVVPEPHEFVARLHLGAAQHRRDYDLEFVEPGHDHVVPEYRGLDVSAPGYQDPHELAHADDIRRRFANRNVTTGQIIMFGVTGGLIPCPASITVLLLCLQLKQVALGATLVLCFSIGLVLTMVSSGTIAALGMRHAARHFSGFGEFARRAPYLSGALILLVGCYVGFQGLRALG